MYLHYRLFFRALDLALLKQPFRLRRWAFVTFFTGLFLGMRLIVAFGRMLDHLFFPGFRRQLVREPLFIIAPPRSGTTFLQNLISLDSERFVHAKLYQMIFPCICYQLLLRGIFKADMAIGSPLMMLVKRAEKAWFGEWDGMHKMRFNAPEEEDGFFVYTFVTEAIYLLFPFVDQLWEAGFADALPLEERRKLMRYYKGCLQRHLYINGPTKRIMAKGTQLSGSVKCILEAFPDAKFLTIIRHPYAAVPSHVSVFYPVWRAHSPEIMRNSPVSKSYARLAIEWYRNLYKMRSQINARNYCCISFTDFIADPLRILERVYRDFAFDMSQALRERLRVAILTSRKFKSDHKYTLEEFGLSRLAIQEQIGDILDAYGLQR